MIDGYAGTSLSLSYVAYRLAVHPDIQERLYNEIMDKLDTHVSTHTFTIFSSSISR